MQFSTAIDGFHLYLLTANYSPVTAANYKRFLLYFCGKLDDPPVNEVTHDHITGFFSDLRKLNRSEATVQTYWCAIRSFFKWSAETLETGRPEADIPRPNYIGRAIIPFTREEIDLLIKACTSKRNKAIVLFLLDTGVRISEAARMQLGDVNLEEGTALVRPFHNSLKSKPRLVQIGRMTRRALWEYINSRVDTINNTAPLLATHDGRFMDRGEYTHILVRLGKRANIKSVHPHRFRHTFAIEYLRNGGDIFTLQDLLGHRSLVMVRHYLHLSQSDIANAHRKASPVDNWRL